ncbi:winged helix-turn-helix domain-containing protein [Streptomyces sp. NPDC046215]
MWELLISLHRLQLRDAAALFGPWRRQTARRAPASTRMLTALAPVPGYSMDFLTPALGRSLADQGEALRSTPRQRVRADLAMYSRLNPGRPLPTWCADLARGEAHVLGRLADTALHYADRCLAPYWQHIEAAVNRERAQRATLLAESGWAAVFDTLHPSARWQPPVLELDYATDRDLHLEGRGIILQPSFFCRYRPTSFADPVLPPILVYPIDHELGWADASGTERRALSALIGATRAQLLSAAGDGVATTSELARRVGISPSNASRHLAVLKEAGLLCSHRHRNAVLHTITPAGATLLEGRGIRLT